jgi:hypothetical protein
LSLFDLEMFGRHVVRIDDYGRGHRLSSREVKRPNRRPRGATYERGANVTNAVSHMSGTRKSSELVDFRDLVMFDFVISLVGRSRDGYTRDLTRPGSKGIEEGSRGSIEPGVLYKPWAFSLR